MLTDIRLLSHQLAKPRFRSPKELVAWMGAVQAQEYTMAKWAVGTRLKVVYGQPSILMQEAGRWR